MTLRSTAAGGVTALLGTGPVAAAWRRLRPGLRIVAYHGVDDPEALDAQLATFARHHRFVSAAEVGAALRGDGTLPPGALWLTFDDADPSVVRAGLPVLAARAVPATLYVCPGLLDPPAAPWWAVVEAAGRRGRGAEVAGAHRRGTDLVRALKGVPDPVRRQVVADLAAVADPPAVAPTTPAEVRAWLDAGLEVGNHTWDHPCLDRCTAEDQTEQVVRAHRWMEEHLGAAPRTFAYPNGDRTPHVAALAADLGYETVLLFDHAVARVRPGGRELSRLRLDAADPPPRARAVVSGAHSDVWGAGRAVAGRLRRRRTGDLPGPGAVDRLGRR